MMHSAALPTPLPCPGCGIFNIYGDKSPLDVDNVLTIPSRFVIKRNGEYYYKANLDDGRHILVPIIMEPPIPKYEKE